MQNIIFIHGLESSGDGFKGQLFRSALPGCLTPNFTPYTPQISIRILLKERMNQLIPILSNKTLWIIIGSSFGGLMGALFALKYPSKISKLILLAPYLSPLILDPKKYSPINVPVIVFHGNYDEIVSIKRSLRLAEKLFTNLIYNKVDDDHKLKKTVEALNWKKIIEN
ncbi:MAG: alpha/beta fold hydrolase [Candidatus Lokiarchaeota archaeon]|nr:alpha/beta fold hydrolase [Candidatus Lokiarchaeota archaeon]